MSNPANQQRKPTPYERGRSAYRAGIGLHDCPDDIFPDGTAEWMNGWKDEWHQIKVSAIEDGLADRPKPKVETKAIEWESED